MKRLLEIAKRYRPAKTKVRFRSDQKIMPAHAAILADGSREMFVPRPVHRDALFVYLHECAHLHLGHCYPTYDGLLSVQEYEAEQWAIATMRREGVPVSRKIMKEAKRYVRECIKEDLRKGRAAPPYRIRKWCGYK